jgi:glycosyltransferase involved in cell wall biosynthesis
VKRVLLVSATAKAGGAERSFAALARRLPAAGFDAQVALLERGPLEDWLAETPITEVTAGDLPDLACAADVVVANKWRAQLVAGPAAARAQRPCVWWQQDSPRASPPELLDGSVPAAVAVCASDAVLADQRRAAPWLPAVRVPLGIAVDEVAAHRGSGRALRAEHGAPLLRTAARLCPGQRQDEFLQAAAHVARQRPDVRFAVIGGDILGTHAAYEARLRALATELGLADRVTFAGHRPDVYAWIDALDVLVHPADHEPLGRVILEALVLGKRVVAADAGGPAEILHGDARGDLVPALDTNALAAGILRVLDRPAPQDTGTTFTDARMTDGFARLLGEVAR